MWCDPWPSNANSLSASIKQINTWQIKQTKVKNQSYATDGIHSGQICLSPLWCFSRSSYSMWVLSRRKAMRSDCFPLTAADSSVSWPVVVTWSKWVFKRVLCELQGSSLTTAWNSSAEVIWNCICVASEVSFAISMLERVFKNTWSRHLVSVHFGLWILAPILFLPQLFVARC